MVEMQFHLNPAGGFIINQTGVFVSIPREAVLDVQLLAGRMGYSKESCAAIWLIRPCR